MRDPEVRAAVDPRTHDRLTDLARARGVSRAAVVRAALADLLGPDTEAPIIREFQEDARRYALTWPDADVPHTHGVESWVAEYQAIFHAIAAADHTMRVYCPRWDIDLDAVWAQIGGLALRDEAPKDVWLPAVRTYAQLVAERCAYQQDHEAAVMSVDAASWTIRISVTGSRYAVQDAEYWWRPPLLRHGGVATAGMECERPDVWHRAVRLLLRREVADIAQVHAEEALALLKHREIASRPDRVAAREYWDQERHHLVARRLRDDGHLAATRAALAQEYVRLCLEEARDALRDSFRPNDVVKPRVVSRVVHLLEGGSPGDDYYLGHRYLHGADEVLAPPGEEATVMEVHRDGKWELFSWHTPEDLSGYVKAWTPEEDMDLLGAVHLPERIRWRIRRPTGVLTSEEMLPQIRRNWVRWWHWSNPDRPRWPR